MTRTVAAAMIYGASGYSIAVGLLVTHDSHAVIVCGIIIALLLIAQFLELRRESAVRRRQQLREKSLEDRIGALQLELVAAETRLAGEAIKLDEELARGIQTRVVQAKMLELLQENESLTNNPELSFECGVLAAADFLLRTPSKYAEIVQDLLEEEDHD